MTNENVLVRISGAKPFTADNPDWVEIEFAEFPGISDRADRLLHRAGDCEVAFRKSVAGLEGDDFVSFANSRNGGAILVGVHLRRYRSGRPRSELVGCPVGDRERLKILAKSNQCVPPVPVSIFAENLCETPFYRIEIASGRRKPYCTSGGTYKIRSDGRNEMLYPAQLRALFLEVEGRELVPSPQPAPSGDRPAVDGQGTVEHGCSIRPGWHMPADSNGAGSAEDADSIAERTEDCDVRLSSQDLCGFLMRLP